MKSLVFVPRSERLPDLCSVEDFTIYTVSSKRAEGIEAHEEDSYDAKILNLKFIYSSLSNRYQFKRFLF